MGLFLFLDRVLLGLGNVMLTVVDSNYVLQIFHYWVLFDHKISTYSKVPFWTLSTDRTRSDSQFLLAATQPVKNEGFCSILLWNLLGPHRLAFYWNVRWVLWLFRPLFWILTNRHLFYQKNSCFRKFAKSSRNQVCDFGGELLLIIWI